MSVLLDGRKDGRRKEEEKKKKKKEDENGIYIEFEQPQPEGLETKLGQIKPNLAKNKTAKSCGVPPTIQYTPRAPRAPI